MPLFRKKPMVIEAIKWTGENADEVQVFLHNGHPIAAHGWVKGRYVEIGTLEGLMVASIGDWVIKGVRDEFYPCKPDIFAQTYEPVVKGRIEGDDDLLGDLEISNKVHRQNEWENRQ